MDVFKADKIRKAIRTVTLICALGAAVTAFIFRVTQLRNGIGVCMTSRVFAILTFVLTVGLLVFDFATKAFSPQAAGIAAIGGAVMFIGNFIVAPASTVLGLAMYAINHLDGDVASLSAGSYMILVGGVFVIGWTLRAMKNDK